MCVQFPIWWPLTWRLMRLDSDICDHGTVPWRGTLLTVMLAVVDIGIDFLTRADVELAVIVVIGTLTTDRWRSTDIPARWWWPRWWPGDDDCWHSTPDIWPKGVPILTRFGLTVLLTFHGSDAYLTRCDRWWRLAPWCLMGRWRKRWPGDVTVTVACWLVSIELTCNVGVNLSWRRYVTVPCWWLTYNWWCYLLILIGCDIGDGDICDSPLLMNIVDVVTSIHSNITDDWLMTGYSWAGDIGGDWPPHLVHSMTDIIPWFDGLARKFGIYSNLLTPDGDIHSA